MFLLENLLILEKNPKKKKEIRIAKKLEEERKKVQPIYSAEGGIIEYDKYGRHLNIQG